MSPRRGCCCLSRRVNLLNSDIKEEEARTTIRDLANPFYPILTRNLRSRRDNLLATIAVLRTQLERREVEFAELPGAPIRAADMRPKTFGAGRLQQRIRIRISSLSPFLSAPIWRLPG